MTVSRDAIEQFFALVDAHGLETLTFRDLDPAGPDRAGVVFSFDDNAPDALCARYTEPGLVWKTDVSWAVYSVQASVRPGRGSVT